MDSYFASNLCRCLKGRIHYNNLFIRNLSTSKSMFAARNYYEVLGITNRFKCTNKDIREAYLKKCKKYHPDVKLSNQSEQEIKLINEAYSILSKEKEKAFYDLQLDRNMSTTTNYHVRVDSEELLRRYYDEMLRRQMEMNNAKDTSFNNNNKYYGIDGIPRVSNFTIICICGGVIITGIIVHFLHYHFVLSNSFERLQLKSKEIGETYLKKKKELSLKHKTKENKQVEATN